MNRPKNVTQMRAFIGCVNYYRDMWPKRSHILAPLTDHIGSNRTKTAPIIWNKEMEKAFKQMKVMLSTQVMTSYPDHNLPFQIYTDASDL